jgi:uncharacterized protein with PIN domain
MPRKRKPNYTHCPMCKGPYEELKRPVMKGFVTRRCPTCRSELSIPKKMLEEG